MSSRKILFIDKMIFVTFYNFTMKYVHNILEAKKTNT